ncbi:hypothetical protein [Pseudonocardia humida]|uniref:Uncharacterized protein n=1 Tax=Pseudonocardia humida TaxID=2800819 RepID=A0ABT1A2C7_9PSEU|nr:hypothetical protein [Pseudonocardia humida]MCO1657111.1 hypothetical protein [Pseudonocardia humida]
MSYRWRYQDENGAEVSGPEQEFASQEEARGWFADQWLSLRGLGVKRVVLLEDGAETGPPTELEEA